MNNFHVCSISPVILPHPKPSADIDASTYTNFSILRPNLQAFPSTNNLSKSFQRMKSFLSCLKTTRVGDPTLKLDSRTFFRDQRRPHRRYPVRMCRSAEDGGFVVKFHHHPQSWHFHAFVRNTQRRQLFVRLTVCFQDSTQTLNYQQHLWSKCDCPNCSLDQMFLMETYTDGSS